VEVANTDTCTSSRHIFQFLAPERCLHYGRALASHTNMSSGYKSFPGRAVYFPDCERQRKKMFSSIGPGRKKKNLKFPTKKLAARK